MYMKSEMSLQDFLMGQNEKEEKMQMYDIISYSFIMPHKWKLSMSPIV